VGSAPVGAWVGFEVGSEGLGKRAPGKSEYGRGGRRRRRLEEDGGGDGGIVGFGE